MEKKTWIVGISSFIVGALLSLVVIYNSAGGMMMVEDEVPYTFDEAVEKYTKAVKDNGWALPHVHDLQKAMKKYGHTVSPVKVFEICHADLSSQVLKLETDDRIVASMMPCRVSIYEKNGKVFVSRMNTALMGGMMGGIVPKVMIDASAASEKMLQPILN